MDQNRKKPQASRYLLHLYFHPEPTGWGRWKKDCAGRVGRLNSPEYQAAGERATTVAYQIILAFPLHWPPFLQTHIKHCSAFSRLLNLLSQNEGLISLAAVCLEAIRARKSWLFL